MFEKITQTDLDNLADIIWWIKGYHAGARENFEECPFRRDHIESIRKARSTIQEIKKHEHGVVNPSLSKTIRQELRWLENEKPT